MKLSFLGAGDAFATKQGHNSAYLEFNNTNLFIDFPATNREVLLNMGKDVDFVENLFITHLHADHINGVEQLAYLNKFVFTKKINLYISKDMVTDFWDLLKHGMGKVSENKSFKIQHLGDYFNVNLIDKYFSIANQKFEIVQTNHVPNMLSFGLLVKPYFYFSADAKLDRDFINQIHPKVEKIYHDCHMWDVSIDPHASLSDLESLSEEIQNKMILMHYQDQFVDLRKRLEFEKNSNFQLAMPLFAKKIKTTVYPGTFDPITNGHVDIIQRAADLFDQVVVLIAVNSKKKPLFSTMERKKMIQDAVDFLPNVTVDTHVGLITDYLSTHNIYHVVKGLRAVTDFDYEMQIAAATKDIDPYAETIFLPTTPKNTYLSSSIVKERAIYGNDVRHLVPEKVYPLLKEKLQSE